MERAASTKMRAAQMVRANARRTTIESLGSCATRLGPIMSTALRSRGMLFCAVLWLGSISACAVQSVATQNPASGFDISVQVAGGSDQVLAIKADGSGCERLVPAIERVCLLAINRDPAVIGGAAFGALNSVDTPSLDALVWRARIEGDVGVCDRGGLLRDRLARCKVSAQDENYAMASDDMTIRVTRRQ
jgi:hypothetical protein